MMSSRSSCRERRRTTPGPPERRAQAAGAPEWQALGAAALQWQALGAGTPEGRLPGTADGPEQRAMATTTPCVCVNGGQSSVWHGSPRRLALKLRRLAFPAVHGQLLSAGGHGSPRPRRTAAPAGNEASRAPPRGETNRRGWLWCEEGNEGMGRRGFFCEKTYEAQGVAGGIVQNGRSSIRGL
jgi:hypothetical protein